MGNDTWAETKYLTRDLHFKINPIISPEHALTRQRAIDVFRASKLEMFVNFNFSTVPDDRAWIRTNLCPSKLELDLFVSDMDCAAPLHLWQNMMSVCRPRHFFMGNSGLLSCAKSALNRDFFYEEEYLHAHGTFRYEIAPPLTYELVVDRNLSRIRGWSEIPKNADRRFSLYHRVGH